MISNSTSYKLKASKSSRDLNEFIDNNKNEDNESSEDQELTPKSFGKSDNENDVNYGRSQSSSYNSRDLRFKPRGSKSFEYRSTRALPPERRSTSWRGRGSYGFRKYEETPELGYVSRKFQEPLNKHSFESNKSYHSKYFDTEKPKNDYSLNIFEDTRISKLIRRLSSETDQEKSLVLCKKLLDVVIIPDNSRYVNRAFSMLVDSLYDCLTFRPGTQTKKQIARILGRIGYVLESDFKRYFDWLFHQKYINSKEEIKVLLIKSLKETLLLEKSKSKLKEFMSDIMVQTQSILETTDVPNLFIATMEVVLLLEELHPTVFTDHFRDTVDILLGWHVDSNQTVYVTEFVSKSLVKLSKHWQNNVNFSLNLMSQFLEDMEPYSEQLHSRYGRTSPLDSGAMSTDDILERITSLIRAFNTVVKCLGDTFNPVTNSAVSITFVTECLGKVLKITLEALENYVPDNLAITSNECVALLLGILQNKAGSISENLYNLIDLELTLTYEFTDAATVSMLLMISKVIKELSANLPIELVQKLIGPKSEILKLRFSQVTEIQSAVIEVYHSLLNLKNIPLLQEAYRCVLGDLELSYKVIVPNIKPFCQNNPFETSQNEISEAELTCLFLLRSLSILANASSSIIGMWALRPSILELLAIDLEPYNTELGMRTPTLQYCIFYLLFSHSKCYNHFLSSSSLITSPESKANVIDKLGLPMNIGDVSTSPSSGNLNIILEILCKSLKIETNIETKLLLLQWLQDIFGNAKMYQETLCVKQEFIQIIEAIISAGYSCDSKITINVCESIKILLQPPRYLWNKNFYNSLYDLCILHINSLDENVSNAYTELFSNLMWFTPISNAIVPKSTVELEKTYSTYQISLKQNLHMKRSIGELLQLQFKKFTSYLLKGDTPLDIWLQDIFICCSPLDSENNFEIADFRTTALNSRNLLYFWVAWESALLCVNYKLRTPLGKPTETFTCIENSLKHLAKEAIGLITDNGQKLSPLQEQVRTGLLLDFMEHLEKLIYNASEGCSEVLLPPPKPVRTFFHTNVNTCKEWLARIRLPVVDVSLKSGHYTVTIRNCQAKLKDLVTAENTSGPEFDRTVINYANALIHMSDSESLRGLYVWCNKVTNRKFNWLKPAVDQVNKRYELAIKKYQEVLKTFENQENPDPKSPLNKFVYHQIIECYKSLNDWDDLIKWKTDELKLVSHCPDLENNDELNFAKAAKAFEQGSLKSLEKLSTWAKTENKQPAKWGVRKMLEETEINLFKIAVNLKNGTMDDVISNLETNLISIHCNIKECLRNSSNGLLKEFFLLQNAANGMKKVINKEEVYNLTEELNYVENLDASTLSKVAFWFDYFESMKNTDEDSLVSNLYLKIARTSRKEGNLSMAQEHIQKYLSLKKELHSLHENNGNQWNILENVAQFIVQSGIKLDRTLCTPENAKAMVEISKLLYLNDKNRSLALNVCASACAGISNQVNFAKDANLQETGSKLLMTLAKWIQKESDQQLVKEINNPIGRFLLVLPDIGVCDTKQASLAFDMASGKLLQFGVKTYPRSAKMWYTFGEWCYNWGKSAVDISISSGSQLSENDRVNIRQQLPNEIPMEDLEKVYEILSQTRDILDKDGISNDMNLAERIEFQLEEITFVNNLHPDYISNLVDIWRGAQKRLYHFYELAAEAFFQSLQLCTNNDLIEPGAECMSITATLRLLRFIVKHAMELQSVIEKGLASTPTHPWKAIIPQLFSRLNHPEEYVRRRVSELLCRVATDAPHLIIFPAVVGAVEGGHKFDLNDISMPKDYLIANVEEMGEIDDEFEDRSETDESRDVLHSCFMTMVETLRKQAPETITQVQSFVSELRRISLLWDELWISTLVQHHGEIMKRLTQLETEITKTENNSNLTLEEKDELIKEKHRIIIKPIIFILEQLQEITSQEPETPHEKVFQEKYIDLINEVLDKLKNPENPHKPQDSWQSLKTLQLKLQQRAHKRASFALKMTEISPILANMRDTVITMPGLSSAHKHVTILSISHQVNILPTKTKPKKLYFHGSDGQTYTYLFKGMEDLHLDERIMQFLTIANTMMARNAKDGNFYRARHYPVIPLGLRSGLISWVDETTPMFTLYKRWQMRDVAVANMKSGGNAVVLRPSEIFYKKLTPLLKEHGIKNTDNRKEWPLSVLKQVLVELMAETPSDLLAKELWCRSVDASKWWEITNSYSRSVAVMSIIGYIIGLGDRHLDNVLVDLRTGELVHIDYNVCFEKGKQLRVPEKVPFRMTPNMENALGLTGLEGTFRLACEKVLTIMQAGRETLLTLLEAFVVDPLVDWQAGGGVLRAVVPGGRAQPPHAARLARRNLERELNLAMLNVRRSEMKEDWNSNREDILKQLTLITKELNQYILEHQKVKQTDDHLLELHQQMALIKEAEYHGRNHSLYTLPKRFALQQQTQNCIQGAQKALEDKLSEFEAQIKLHNTALGTLRGAQIAQWAHEITNFPLEHDSNKLGDIVSDFLHNAGQSNMITQLDQLEGEVATYAQQQLLCIQKCLDLLNQYGAIACLYPLSYLEKHRSVCYVKWCKKLLEQKSVEACHEVLTEFNIIYSPETVNNPLTQQVITFSYQLQGLLNDVNVRMQKTFDRLSMEGTPERLEKSYNEAKASINNFLRNEKGASKAFECVTISALCGLNKRYLTMETAAASAGDYLVDLTSRDGDWFLDEMHLMSSLVTELSSLIPPQTSKSEDTKISLVLNCLKNANDVYKDLQDLNFNFHTIILPETLKTIQTEEMTVLQMINDVNNIILNIGYSLPDIMGQLERHLRFTIMEMDSPHGNVQTILTNLRHEFEKLLHAHQNTSENLTPGQMLLMGFNGLFDKLQVDSHNLISTLSSIDTPSCWKKIDQFKEAKSLAAPVFNHKTRSVLDDIFLLKRIQTMSEFFSLCFQMGQAFKGIGIAAVFDDERLSKPIKRFTADYVSRQLLGVTSQTISLALCLLLQRLGINVTNEIEQRDIGAENKVPLEDLCRKAVDVHVKRGTFTTNIFAQASGLCSNLETAWRKREVTRYIQQSMEIQRSTLTRLQLMLTAHHWYHEDIILLQPGLAQQPMRTNFLGEMRKACTSMLAVQTRLSESREQLRSLVSSVEQRLKWAAGANPDLNDIMAQFECTLNIKDDRLNLEQNLAGTISGLCNTILLHEALRTRTPEAMTNDSMIITLVKKWESSCILVAARTEEVTHTEAGLLGTIPLVDGNIDANWIQKASNTLSELISEAQKLNSEQKEVVSELSEELKTRISKIKSLLGMHHKLFSDVRSLLRSLARQDDCPRDLHRYLGAYRTYLETFTSILHKFGKEQILDDKQAEDILITINLLEEQTHETYDNLFSLEWSANRDANSRPALVRQEGMSGNWVDQSVKGGATAGRNVEQRNAYAVAAWHKVRLKLEGRDPDPGVKYTAKEQVDYVIREATNLDNLALLYEGWTPWV